MGLQCTLEVKNQDISHELSLDITTIEVTSLSIFFIFIACLLCLWNSVDKEQNTNSGDEHHRYLCFIPH